ncbi:MAG: hypothetical protein ABJH45_02625 [Paracoccaceae bacterium]
MSTLVSTILLIALVSVVQAKLQGNLRIIGALLNAERTQLYARGVAEMVRGDVGLAIIAPEGRLVPSLDGAGYVMRYAERDWRVHLQDVEGLVDIYSASEVQKRAAGIPPQAIAALRRALEQSGTAARYATLQQTMAVYGIDPNFASVLTQDARDPRIQLENSPTPLRQALVSLPPNELKFDQARRVRVEVVPVAN